MSHKSVVKVRNYRDGYCDDNSLLSFVEMALGDTTGARRRSTLDEVERILV